MLLLVQLPATAIGDVSTASLLLQNTTSESQTFEFSIPEGSDLTLSPHVGSLPAGGALRVLLRYCPRAETNPPCPAGALTGQTVEDANQLQPRASSLEAAEEGAGEHASLASMVSPTAHSTTQSSSAFKQKNEPNCQLFD